jgi:hypothetical protein
MNEIKFTKKQIDFIRLMGDPYAKLSLTDKFTAYKKRSENPYAGLSNLYDPDDQINKYRNTRIIIHNILSKKRFQSECRNIFLQYIPSAGRKQIKPEHKSFITRNENRTPEERFGLLNELKKYDLSRHIEYHGHFNRERENLTEIKLRAIEKILEK